MARPKSIIPVVDTEAFTASGTIPAGGASGVGTLDLTFSLPVKANYTCNVWSPGIASGAAIGQAYCTTAGTLTVRFLNLTTTPIVLSSQQCFLIQR